MDEASRKKVEEGKKKLEALKAKKKAAAAAAAAAVEAPTASAPPQVPEKNTTSPQNGINAEVAPAGEQSPGDTAGLQTKLAEAEARADRLQGQVLSLMQALEQNTDGNSPARAAGLNAEKLQERLAESDEKMAALKIALAERDEQLDLACLLYTSPSPRDA